MISFNQRKTKKLIFLWKIEKKAVKHRRWRAISCQTRRPQKSIDDCIDFSNSFFFNQNFASKEKKFLKENFEIFWLFTPITTTPTGPFCPKFGLSLMRFTARSGAYFILFYIRVSIYYIEYNFKFMYKIVYDLSCGL